MILQTFLFFFLRYKLVDSFATVCFAVKGGERSSLKPVWCLLGETMRLFRAIMSKSNF